MISIRSHVIRYFSARYMKRVTPERDVHELRKGLESRTSILPPARRVSIRATVIDDIGCEWHVPEGCEDAPIILYLHGGAFVMGSPATHRRLVSHIARAAGMRALVPDYRLAPEHRFPAALEDSLKMYRHLRSRQDDAKLIIGGDSAGGNLSAATLLALRDAGEELPVACFLMSPWLDMTAAGESLQTRATSDPWFRPEHVAPTAAKVFSEFERRNPLVSPIFADASNLPPILIHVGDHEILLSDSTRLADNIRQAGGDVELRVWDGMWHVFQFFVGQMPESDRSIKEIGHFLRSKVGDLTAQERAA
ncbi:MAG: alpha/beta hydrolase [Woeseiaceae bacterium]|nr:alpha/beta hydrolase [Woeseiaceae bacterium]